MTKFARTVSRFLRVNHAGEYGAIRIYSAQIAVARRTRPDIVPFLEEALAHERRHLDRFRALMPARGTRPYATMPVWGVGGTLLGLMTAVMGKNGIAICTEAIERTVHRHLNDQIAWLDNRDPEFADAIREVRDEEMGHLNDAIGMRTCTGPAARLLDGFVALVTRTLIWLSAYGAASRTRA
jgi:ubiquinone biosynthesis monooxygenase Coq7